VQERVQVLQLTTPLPDRFTETDEMFQNAGEKGDKHSDPLDPPRVRGNKRPRKGTYDNDRPPIVGTIERESGQVRLRVVTNRTGEILSSMYINLRQSIHNYLLINQQVVII